MRCGQHGAFLFIIPFYVEEMIDINAKFSLTLPAGVKIVVASSHYAASLQRSSSEGLFFSGLSRTIATGFQLRMDLVHRFGLLCRACV